MSEREQWNEDLLSAYVDGEVTEEERVMVEARLDESPSLRALLSEIESAREAVRSLPQRDAPPEFWARILGGTGLDTAAGVADAPASVVALEPRIAERRASRVPRWVAAAGGVAAAAVIAAVVLVPAPQRVDPPVASFTDAHAVRNSLDSEAVSSLAPVALQAGFRR